MSGGSFKIEDKEVTCISGPVSMSVFYGSIPDVDIYLFGDKHKEISGYCDKFILGEETSGCYTVYDLLEKVFANTKNTTDFFVECPNYYEEKRYKSHDEEKVINSILRYIPYEKVPPIDAICLRFKRCLLPLGTDECISYYPYVRFHYCELRFEPELKLLTSQVLRIGWAKSLVFKKHEVEEMVEMLSAFRTAKIYANYIYNIVTDDKFWRNNIYVPLFKKYSEFNIPPDEMSGIRRHLINIKNEKNRNYIIEYFKNMVIQWGNTYGKEYDKTLMETVEILNTERQKQKDDIEVDKEPLFTLYMSIIRLLSLVMDINVITGIFLALEGIKPPSKIYIYVGDNHKKNIEQFFIEYTGKYPYVAVLYENKERCLNIEDSNN